MKSLEQIDLSSAFELSLESTIADEIFVPQTPAISRRNTYDLEQALFEIEPSLPSVGVVLDKYRLERAIGIGGFAVVFRARHVLLDTVFALKLLRPSVLQRRPELGRSLGEEARLAARLVHPHVVRVVDVTMEVEHPYIVMDYVHGPDLAAMLRHKGQLPTRMVMRIVRHVSAALAAGLGESLVHRDVKPSNILLTRSGVTKLVDFGLARSTAMVGHREIVGTLGYMSPEHIQAPQDVDHRSDIFSLGMTAYRALTGAAPLRASSSAHDALITLKNTPIKPPHRLSSQVPLDVSRLIMWMLELDPARRPQTYEALRVGLDALALRE
ncbi:MAG: serine/threonine-protein kinase [Kofleriaceae bacterium]